MEAPADTNNTETSSMKKIYTCIRLLPESPHCLVFYQCLIDEKYAAIYTPEQVNEVLKSRLSSLDLSSLPYKCTPEICFSTSSKEEYDIRCQAAKKADIKRYTIQLRDKLIGSPTIMDMMFSQFFIYKIDTDYFYMMNIILPALTPDPKYRFPTDAEIDAFLIQDLPSEDEMREKLKSIKL
jgi:hypothetical protein